MRINIWLKIGCKVTTSGSFGCDWTMGTLSQAVSVPSPQ